MGETRRYIIDLPPGIADALDRKVASGAYGSASDVIEDALSAMFDADGEAVLTSAMKGAILASLAEFDADPTQGIPVDQIEQWLDKPDKP